MDASWTINLAVDDGITCRQARGKAISRWQALRRNLNKHVCLGRHYVSIGKERL
jgi:hypothetical protein